MRSFFHRRSSFQATIASQNLPLQVRRSRLLRQFYELLRDGRCARNDVSRS